MAIANSMDLAARAGRVNISLDDNEAFQTNKFGAVWMTEEDHGPLVVFIELPPNIESPAHFHLSEYVAVIMKGSIRVGRTWYEAGSSYVQDRDQVYGPTMVGPEGLRIAIFFADRQGLPDQFAKASDQEAYGDRMVELLRCAKREIGFPGFGADLDELSAAASPTTV